MPESLIFEVISLVVSSALGLIGAGLTSDVVAKVLVGYAKNRLKSLPASSGSVSALERRTDDGGPNFERAAHPNVDIARQHLAKRLVQCVDWERKSRLYAEIFGKSAALLSFTQYIVGGVLTLSFANQVFSPKLVGAFGVIVFAASAANQKFNPQAKSEVAQTRAELLESLIQETEDNIVDIVTTTDFSNDDPKPFLLLTKKVSAEMSKIRNLSTRRKAK